MTLLRARYLAWQWCFDMLCLKIFCAVVTTLGLMKFNPREEGAGTTVRDHTRGEPGVVR